MPLYLKQGHFFLFVKVVLEYSLGLDSIRYKTVHGFDEILNR